jgi:hypothetical protein
MSSASLLPFGNVFLISLIRRVICVMFKKRTLGNILARAKVFSAKVERENFSLQTMASLKLLEIKNRSFWPAK